MKRRDKRTVTRHTRERNATEMRRKLEHAQAVLRDGGVTAGANERARELLAKHGVRPEDNITQSRKRTGGWWRVQVPR